MISSHLINLMCYILYSFLLIKFSVNHYIYTRPLHKCPLLCIQTHFLKGVLPQQFTILKNRNK